MENTTTSLKFQPLVKKSGVMNGGLTLFIFSFAILFSSCASTSYKNTSRIGEVAETKVALNANVVDVEVDFENRIQATSAKTKRVAEAKNQAYYRAIVNNKIDVLVDPIYEVVTTSRKSVATVTGYGGLYKNVRTVQQENQLAFEQNLRNTQATFEQTMVVLDRKLLALDKFSKVDAVAKEELKTHLIIAGGEGADAIDKEINTNIGIVDKYNAFSNGKTTPVATSGAILSAGPKEDSPGIVSMIAEKMKKK